MLLKSQINPLFYQILMLHHQLLFQWGSKLSFHELDQPFIFLQELSLTLYIRILRESNKLLRIHFLDPENFTYFLFVILEDLQLRENSFPQRPQARNLIVSCMKIELLKTIALRAGASILHKSSTVLILLKER